MARTTGDRRRQTDVVTSPEIRMRAERSLTAIAAAKDYDASRPKSRGPHSAQLWEIARFETAGFFGALSDETRLSSILESRSGRRPYDRSLGRLVADLKVAQTMLSSEMLFLLSSTGYKPPPPAHKLITDTAHLVIDAVSMVGAAEYDPKDDVPDSGMLVDKFSLSLGALSIVHRRLVGLEGLSTKRVRREVSRLRKPVAIIASAVAATWALAGSTAAEPIKDALKAVIEHQIDHIPGLKDITDEDDGDVTHLLRVEGPDYRQFRTSPESDAQDDWDGRSPQSSITGSR